MHKYFTLLTFIIAVALGLPAAAQPAKNATIGERGASEASTITAKVEAVDLANRMVTLRGPMGHSVTLKVDDRVKNLAQVKVGDDLVINYLESVSLELKKGSTGRMDTTSSSGPVTAPMGDKPGVAATSQRTMVANVEQVDKKRSVVLLHGPQGRYAEVKVRDPKIMQSIKVGDSVQATYTEAVLIEVVGPAKK